MVAFGEATDSPIEKQEAELLSDLKLSVSLSNTKPLKETGFFKDGCSGAAGATGGEGVSIGYALSGKKNDKTYLDLRVIGDKAYAKADVRGLAELAGEDAATVDQGLSELPPEAAPIKDLIDGKWVSVDPDTFKELSRQMQGGLPEQGAAGGSPSAAPSVDPSVLQHFCDSMKKSLSENVSLEDLGKSGDADVIRVAAPLRPLVESLYDSFSEVAQDVPGTPKFPSRKEFGDFQDVPNRKLAADVRIVDGRASAITVDLAQFADKTDWSAHLPLRLGISTRDVSIAAPSDATPLDLDKLQELFASMDQGGDYEDFSDDSGFDSNGLTPAEPLTESEFAQLKQLGIDRETAEAMNRSGLAFAEIKELAPELT
ncbi:hypothetical protein HUT16_21675 [Kitasatospora sp. NA04385]|uniref:hypothetical protein n=1 Tax=Kitasatospora sp. NA04385 TaxID=2742135 RepID=UPI001591B1A8|nr:hypothetical protein [Kitasatospora sp. NA04385]QKW21323.1 hypothetical protein HUT16_21675 [Kitasatospora sp. NA04385]